MELKLSNGQYSAAIGRGLETVSGCEELAQRICMKLTARRGAFWPLPDYGSRLYKLIGSEKISDRETAVREYVAEALADERNVSLSDFTLRYPETDVLELTLRFDYLGESFQVAVTI